MRFNGYYFEKFPILNRPLVLRIPENSNLCRWNINKQPSKGVSHSCKYIITIGGKCSISLTTYRENVPLQTICYRVAGISTDTTKLIVR